MVTHDLNTAVGQLRTLIHDTDISDDQNPSTTAAFQDEELTFFYTLGGQNLIAAARHVLVAMLADPSRVLRWSHGMENMDKSRAYDALAKALEYYDKLLAEQSSGDSSFVPLTDGEVPYYGSRIQSDPVPPNQSALNTAWPWL